MRSRPMVDPRMLGQLGEFFPSRCTIQRDTGTGRSATGDPQPDWQDLDGHANIPCSKAPVAGQRQREVRRGDQTVLLSTARVALQGYFPQITEHHRAVVDGQALNIILALADSRSALTYLDVELVR